VTPAGFPICPECATGEGWHAPGCSKTGPAGIAVPSALSGAQRWESARDGASTTPDPRQLARIRAFVDSDPLIPPAENEAEDFARKSLAVLLDALDEARKRQLIVAGPPRARDTYFMSRIAELEAERDEARKERDAALDDYEQENRWHHEASDQKRKAEAERDRLAEDMRRIERIAGAAGTGEMSPRRIAEIARAALASMEGGGE